MTGESGLLQRVLATWHGQVASLPALECEIARLESAGANIDLAILSAAARLDLADLVLARPRPDAVPASQLADFAGRLGWTIDALRRWNPQADARGVHLQAALISAAQWDCCDDLWTGLAPLVQNGILCEGLRVVVRSRAPQVTIPTHAPVWEREHFEALTKADREADWVQLAEIAHAFRRRGVIDPAASQAVRALAVLDWRRLVVHSADVQTWMEADMIIAVLPIATTFRLAAATSSGHVRFAAIERATWSQDALSPDAESALRHLFAVLARDEVNWPAWMTIINKYPVRYPHMQVSLGRALARSPENALRAYVDAVGLSTPKAPGRAPIAACLEVFRSRATPMRRSVLWRRAFDRWSAWNFGDATGVEPQSRSELDFPVAGWLIEFAEPDVLKDELDAFDERLRALEMQWHSSLSALVADYNRLLSRYHMFAFASSRRDAKGGWLFDREVFVPAAAKLPFARARFGTVG